MQIISNDKTARSNSVNDLKEFNNQSLATQTKKGEQLVSMMPAIKKTFDLMGDDIVYSSTEKVDLRNQIGHSEFNYVWIKKPDGKTLNKRLIYLITIYGKASLITSFLKELNSKI